MQRGSEPHRSRWGLVWALVVIVGGTFGCPAVADAQNSGEPGAWGDPQTTDATGEVDGMGAFERSDSIDVEPPGLRRNADRPWRRAGAPAESRSTGGRLFRTVIWLALVIGLAVGTLYLVRRFVPGTVPAQNRNLVRVLGRGTLGPKQQVVVTQVGGQILILGVTPESIVRLGEITDPEEALRVVPPQETFAGRFAALEEVYPETAATEPVPAPAFGEVADTRLEPYRREVARLQSMVEMWQRQDRLDERGSA